MTALFDKNAPILMSDLMRDFGLTSVQAAGLAGNLGHESAGFSAMVEVGSGSGRGIAQWSGPRAREFEAFCRKLGKTIHDLDANYAFLKHELSGAYASCVRSLKAQKTLQGTTKSFMDTFERPGVPALNSRIRWANLALAAYERQHGIKHAAAGPHPIHTADYHHALAAHHATLARHHEKHGGHHG